MFESSVGKWVSPATAWNQYIIHSGTERAIHNASKLIYGLECEYSINADFDQRDHTFFASTQRRLEHSKHRNFRRYCKFRSNFL